MAFYILDGAAPQRSEIQRIKQNAIKLRADLENVNRQLDEMTDAQIQAQYGVPSGSETAIKTVMANALADVQDTALTNIISSIGFDT